jgi:hypothetical protein
MFWYLAVAARTLLIRGEWLACSCSSGELEGGPAARATRGIARVERTVIDRRKMFIVGLHV